MGYNTFCHVEIHVKDLAAGRDFYQGLFGWKFTEFDPAYWLFSAEGGIGGAITTYNADCPTGRGLMNYLLVEDIDGYMPRILELGGKLTTEKMAIPGIGWSLQFTDPWDNPLGLFQAAPQEG